jgi:hypothetical protein
MQELTAKQVSQHYWICGFKMLVHTYSVRADEQLTVAVVGTLGHAHACLHELWELHLRSANGSKYLHLVGHFLNLQKIHFKHVKKILKTYIDVENIEIYWCVNFHIKICCILGLVNITNLDFRIGEQ